MTGDLRGFDTFGRFSAILTVGNVLTLRLLFRTPNPF